MIINKLFREDAENILTLKKEVFTALNREDRECEEKEPYSWTTCLDELFTVLRECQDPWNINPDVDYKVCTNVTQILRFYNSAASPDLSLWDEVKTGDAWDRVYMAERKLANLERNGFKCKVPCKQVNYLTEMSYGVRNKYYSATLYI